MIERELSPKEISAATGLHYRTVLRFIESGELEAYRYGTAYRVPLSAYERWRAAHRVVPKARARRRAAGGGKVAPLPRRETTRGSVSRLRAIEEGMG